MYKPINTCLYVYVYINIHTHTHIHTRILTTLMALIISGSCSNVHTVRISANIPPKSFSRKAALRMRANVASSTASVRAASAWKITGSCMYVCMYVYMKAVLHIHTYMDTYIHALTSIVTLVVAPHASLTNRDT